MLPDELGFNVPEVYFDGPDRLSILDGVRDTGFGWVRIEAPWQELTTATSAGWTRVDTVVDAALARGLKVLMMTCHPPAGHTASSFGAFCRALATRYQGKVSDFEIWNEENLHTFWAWSDTAKFTTYLKAAYTNIKAVQPDSFVLLGGLAAAASNPWYMFWFKNLYPLDFLKGVYAAGGQGYFDGVANHPYPLTAGFVYENPSQTQLFMRQNDEIRNLMIAKGDGHKPIWWTEIGSDRHEIGGLQQVQDLEVLLECFLSRGYVEKFFIHDYRDINQEKYGMVDLNYVPRPSLQWCKDQVSDV